MTVEVKKVGNYKIHVKNSVVQKQLAKLFFIITGTIGAILEIPIGLYFLDSINPLIPLFGGVVALVSVFAACSNLFCDPAYYVDTTMYGVGGETILKTTPEQDHIAICRAAQKFEKEILERIKREDELKEIVGTCK